MVSLSLCIIGIMMVAVTISFLIHYTLFNPHTCYLQKLLQEFGVKKHPPFTPPYTPQMENRADTPKLNKDKSAVYIDGKWRPLSQDSLAYKDTQGNYKPLTNAGRVNEDGSKVYVDGKWQPLNKNGTAYRDDTGDWKKVNTEGQINKDNDRIYVMGQWAKYNSEDRTFVNPLTGANNSVTDLEGQGFIKGWEEVIANALGK